jgi:hypothetical protein
VAAEFGVYLLIIAALLRFFFNVAVATFPNLTIIDRLWHQVVPFEYSGVAFVAFFLGHLSWFVANR